VSEPCPHNADPALCMACLGEPQPDHIPDAGKMVAPPESVDPGDGIHAIDWQTYGAIRRISPSRLVPALTSMLAYREQEPAENADLAFGRAYHAALIEPEVYATRFAWAPRVDRRTKAGKLAHEDFLADCRASGKEPLTPTLGKNQATIEAMKSRMVAHPVRKWLRAQGGFEVAVLWTDPELGPLKGRLDKLAAADTDRPVIVDLKSTSARLTIESLEREVAAHNYAMKAAMYCDGVQAVTGKAPRFLWIFQEKTPPYDILPLAADDETLGIGREEYRLALARVRHAERTNEWPGVCDAPGAIPTGGLPEYLRARWRRMRGTQ
jgi:hypothetical protein